MFSYRKRGFSGLLSVNSLDAPLTIKANTDERFIRKRLLGFGGLFVHPRFLLFSKGNGVLRSSFVGLEFDSSITGEALGSAKRPIGHLFLHYGEFVSEK